MSAAANWNSAFPLTVIAVPAGAGVALPVHGEPPPDGPQVTTGAGDWVLVAKSTVALVDVASVMYGSRVRLGPAAPATVGISAGPIAAASNAATTPSAGRQRRPGGRRRPLTVTSS